MTGDPIPQHLKVSDRLPSTTKLPSMVGVVIGSTVDDVLTVDGPAARWTVAWTGR
jgi:hypothetical protein